MSFGSICYWCHWGWPKPIAEIYQRARRDIDAVLAEQYLRNVLAGNSVVLELDGEYCLEFGPTHCLWSDENFEGHFQFELQNIDSPQFAEWPKEVLDIIRRSVVEVDALPEEIRCWPEAYDGQHPQNCPPQFEMTPKQEI